MAIAPLPSPTYRGDENSAAVNALIAAGPIYAAAPSGGDDTATLQADIDAAQAAGRKFVLRAGVYRAAGLTYDGDQALWIEGQGPSLFNGASLVEQGTVLRLTASGGRLFQRATGGNRALKKFSGFSCLNASGGSTETAFYSENGTGVAIEDVTVSGFQYGIRHEKTVYAAFRNVQVRGCTYAFDLSNITATGSLTLNTLGSNGYFNNAVVFDRCVATSGAIGYRVAGVSIAFLACDASSMFTTGWQIGGAGYPLTMASLLQCYSEGITAGDMVQAENAHVDLLGFFAGSSAARVIKATSAFVSASGLRSYAIPTLGVDSANSFVTVHDYAGAFGTKWTHTGTGRVRFVSDEHTETTTFTIANGASSDVRLESPATGAVAWDVHLYGRENGTSDFDFAVKVVGSKAYPPRGTKPANLTVAAVLNGNGNYDLRVTNSAGFAYSFQVNAKPVPVSYSAPIPSSV